MYVGIWNHRNISNKIWLEFTTTIRHIAGISINPICVPNKYHVIFPWYSLINKKIKQGVDIIHIALLISSRLYSIIVNHPFQSCLCLRTYSHHRCHRHIRPYMHNCTSCTRTWCRLMMGAKGGKFCIHLCGMQKHKYIMLYGKSFYIIFSFCFFFCLSFICVCGKEGRSHQREELSEIQPRKWNYKKTYMERKQMTL